MLCNGKWISSLERTLTNLQSLLRMLRWEGVWGHAGKSVNSCSCLHGVEGAWWDTDGREGSNGLFEWLNTSMDVTGFPNSSCNHFALGLWEESSHLPPPSRGIYPEEEVSINSLWSGRKPKANHTPASTPMSLLVRIWMKMEEPKQVVISTRELLTSALSQGYCVGVLGERCGHFLWIEIVLSW